jgi:hypothetical protein
LLMFCHRLRIGIEVKCRAFLLSWERLFCASIGRSGFVRRAKNISNGIFIAGSGFSEARCRATSDQVGTSGFVRPLSGRSDWQGLSKPQCDSNGDLRLELIECEDGRQSEIPFAKRRDVEG